MKLRTKLLLGYLGFVLALGLLGTWSARTLSQMSAVSGGSSPKTTSSLWNEGRTPENGRLTVTIREISREDIERAAVWESDDPRERTAPLEGSKEFPKRS